MGDKRRAKALRVLLTVVIMFLMICCTAQKVY
jgi:hypothetical protein